MFDAQGQLQLGLGFGLIVGALLLQFAPHLPAHPQQQQPAGQQQADQRQQLHGDQRKTDPHHHRGGKADQDRLLALFLGQGGGGEADGHGVVAGQHQVHQQDLAEGGRLAGEIGGGEEFHGRSLAATSRRAKRRTCSRAHRQAC